MRQLKRVTHGAQLAFLLSELEVAMEPLLTLTMDQWTKLCPIAMQLPIVHRMTVYRAEEHQKAIDSATSAKHVLGEEKDGGTLSPFHSDCECMIRDITYHDKGPRANAPFRRVTLECVNEAPEFVPVPLSSHTRNSAKGVARRERTPSAPAPICLRHPLFGSQEL